MSFKRTVVAHSPALLIKVAKGIQTLGRQRSAHGHIKELLKSGRPIMLELGSASKNGANGWTTLDVVSGISSPFTVPFWTCMPVDYPQTMFMKQLLTKPRLSTARLLEIHAEIFQ